MVSFPSVFSGVLRLYNDKHVTLNRDFYTDVFSEASIAATAMAGAVTLLGVGLFAQGANKGSIEKSELTQRAGP